MNVLIFGALAVASFFLVKYGLRADEVVEDKRREAIALATFCRDNGLDDLADLLTDFAVGDYSQMVTRVRDFGNEVANGDGGESFLSRVLETQLGKRMQTADGREQVLSVIEKLFGLQIDRKIFETGAKLVAAVEGDADVA